MTANQSQTRLYPDKKGSDKVWDVCGKCGGDKVVHYGNVNVAKGNQVARWCFECGGEGGRYVLVSSLRAKEARHRKAAAEAAAREAEYAKQRAARDAWEAENAELVAKLAELHSRVAQDWLESQLVPNAENQAKLEALVAEHEAAEAAKADVPEGRVTVTGKLVSTKEVENNYSPYGGYVTKMLVEDDRGFRVFGSLPSSLADELYNRWASAEQADKGEEFSFQDYGPQHYLLKSKGARVTFTARLERSRDDSKFGFFSRPTKASVLEKAEGDQ